MEVFALLLVIVALVFVVCALGRYAFAQAAENRWLRLRLEDGEGEAARLEVARGLRELAAVRAREGYEYNAKALLATADEIVERRQG